MRNLKVNVYGKVLLNDKIKTVCYGYDATTEENVAYICDDNLNIYKHSLDSSVSLWKESFPVSDQEIEVVDLTYLPLPDTLAVGLSSGEIWTVHGTTHVLEEAGVCAGGLAAMQWSPDQELVVLVSKENQMILMSYLLDPIAEENLGSKEFGEKSFITVGWGKKETQFHGSEGKEAAKIKVQVLPDLDSNIDYTPKITWRGDGQMYAVGTVVNGIRMFKVFDRDGHLQCTSEKQVGIETNLAWKPSGNLIATTQKLPNKYVVAFFEKNGLKHGDFTIPVDTDTTVKDISWSSDSEVLALQCYNYVKEKYTILLFTSNNYYWYLKQTINCNDEVIKMVWDSMWNQNDEFDASKKLHVFQSNGKYNAFNWRWDVDRSEGKDLTDDAVVGVIDGKKLFVTAFRHAIVPPPMSDFQIESQSNINCVFFGPTDHNNQWDSNSFCVYTEDHELKFYKQVSKVPLKYELFGFFEFGKENCTTNLEKFSWLWLNANTILCIKYDENENTYCVQEYNLNVEEGNVDLKLAHTISIQNKVVELQRHPSDSTKAFILCCTQILFLTIGGNLEKKDIFVRSGSTKLQVLSIENELYFITLTHKNVLTVNGMQNINNISSLLVQSHFLLLTTHQHELICAELLKDSMNSLIDNIKSVKTSQIYKRKIERGAKLIVAVPCNTRTVFQLPRGNLEVIEPRPLSLRIIGQFLDQKIYYSAFDLMRKQRINLNLIHDHNPELFIKNVDTFVREISNSSWLSLFLSDLENIDVTITMYASSYTSKPATPDNIVNSKVTTVCEVIRDSLQKRSDTDAKILPILTTYVKTNTIEDLEKALTVVKELREKENEGEKLVIGSDEALRYLLYLVDVNYLYDIALGMYDFNLVLLVANKSQKDPKEYVPMLNELNEMDENYKKFSINKTLKRFKRAVQCLASCGPSHHEELKTFVKYHSLFRDALELFKPEEETYKQIADDYGLHLKLMKNFVEAGFVYQRGGKNYKAIDCFKEALEWELAIESASDWPKDKLENLCMELVDGLKNEKRHTESLVILEQYCSDLLYAIKYAVECGRFKTSIRLCQKYGKSDLIESLVKPSLQEEHMNLLTTVNVNTETFNKYKERLVLVRAKKQEREDEIDLDYLHKDSDLYSDTGSTIASSGSRGSSRSFKSSKNRRKHERKMVSLKEGSKFEDVALVGALHTLITSSYELRTQVKEITMAMCWFDKYKEAIKLQNNLENLLKTMKESFKEIWSHEFILEATNASITAQLDPEGVPQGIAALDLHLRIPPVIQDINWKLASL